MNSGHSYNIVAADAEEPIRAGALSLSAAVITDIRLQSFATVCPFYLMEVKDGE